MEIATAPAGELEPNNSDGRFGIFRINSRADDQSN